MKTPEFGELDLQIARARLVLSALAMLTLYVDPGVGGPFHLSLAALITVFGHLFYSLAMHSEAGRVATRRYVGKLSTLLDLVFASAIAICAEGRIGPSYVFFVFAIVAASSRAGFRDALAATTCSVAMYLAVIGFTDGMSASHMMRGVYLALAGYLICFLGRQRAAFEVRVREMESKAERLAIARSLHDGYVQTLAGVNLRLETCRALLQRQQPALALKELTELQAGVAREYDSVRSYLRSLVEIDQPTGERTPKSNDTRFEMKADFSVRGTVVEQVLNIALEGLRNAWRHGRASVVKIDIHGVDDMINIRVADDGAGFRDSSAVPWAIASRVAEVGGELKIASAAGAGGALLEIQMPVT